MHLISICGHSKLKTIVKKVASLVTFCLLSFQSSGSEIVDYYPNCVADIIDRKSFRETLRSKNQMVSLSEQQDVQAILISEMKAEGAELGADAIVIYEREVLRPVSKGNSKQSNTRHTLVYRAEFLRYCADDRTLSSRTTPFNKKGDTQFSIGMIRLEQKQIDLSISSAKQEVTSDSIDFDSGVYGVQLGDSQADIESAFGDPSFEFSLSPTDTLLAYGRYLWLHVQNGQLISASTENQYFKQALLNLVPFEDRFDDKPWSVDGALTRGETAYNLELSSESDHVSVKDGIAIKVHWKNNRVGGFTYGYQNDSEQISVEHTETGNYDWLKRYLERDTNEVDRDVTFLIQQARGAINEDRLTQRFVVNSNLLLTVTNESASELILTDTLYPLASTNEGQWSFLQFYQGQTLDEAMSYISEVAFELNDTVQVDFETYQMLLHFYEHGDGRRLYKIEFKLL